VGGDILGQLLERLPIPLFGRLDFVIGSRGSSWFPSFCFDLDHFSLAIHQNHKIVPFKEA
jgi:hypothetical protein